MSFTHTNFRQAEATINTMNNEIEKLHAAAATAAGQRHDLNSRLVTFEEAKVLERIEQLESDGKAYRQREKALVQHLYSLELLTAEQAAEIVSLKSTSEGRLEARTETDAISLPSGAELPENVENVALLPFAIEDIEYHFQARRGSGRPCAAKGCGRVWPTAPCFQDNHYNWCATHHRAVGTDKISCVIKGKKADEPCVIAYWETVNSEAWTERVEYSYRSGLLGLRGVSSLDQILRSAKTLD
ncbi:hypothetical protein NX059_007603 [Plenodomus lindquistii]|nr:hypothetical protein NX059_007603 [Plenodomus lindquistii]